MTPKFNTKRFALQLGAIGVILLALMAATKADAEAARVEANHD